MANIRVVFGNLVCTFGDKGLLDYLESSVFPVFADPKMERRWGMSQYLLLDVNTTVVRLEGHDPLFLVYGRFVNNTVLSRTQILERGKLRASPGQMDSAPSAFFVLILNNHKLIYAYSGACRSRFRVDDDHDSGIMPIMIPG